MHVFENTPDKQPQNFFMGRDTGELIPVYDENGIQTGNESVIIYDVPLEQVVDATGIYYTRKCAVGIRRLHITPFLATLYSGVDEMSLVPIMTQRITQEISEDNGVTWVIPEVLDRVIDADANGLITFLLSTGVGSYCRIDNIDNFFTDGNGKQTYEILATDRLTRLKLEVTIHTPSEAVIDITDFDGPVIYSTEVNVDGEDVITYTFYPDGIEYAVIDPYLSVDEQSTYITITSDDVFEITFKNSTGFGGHITSWYDLLNDPTRTVDLCAIANNQWEYPFHSIAVRDTALYLSRYDHNNSKSILLYSSKTRVVVKLFGYLQDTYGGTSIDWAYSIIYTIYPDGSIYSDSNIINESGSEKTATTTNYLHNYIGVNDGNNFNADASTSTDINIDTGEDHYGLIGNTTGTTKASHLCSTIYSSIPFNFFVYFDAERAISGVLKNGSYTFSIDETVQIVSYHFIGKGTDYFGKDEFNVSLADTQVSGKFGVADDLNLPTVNTGTVVTDLNIPDHIDEGICSDGAQHIDFDSSHEAKITFNQDSIDQPVSLHEASVRTGAVGSPDEHLIFQDKMESVTDGHTSDIGNATIGVTGSPSLLPGERGNGVDFDIDGKYFSIPLADMVSMGFNKTRGTISFSWIPNSDVNLGSGTVNSNWFNNNHLGGDSFYFIGTGYNLKLFIQQDYTDIISLSWGNSYFNYFYAGTLYKFYISWDLELKTGTLTINSETYTLTGTVASIPIWQNQNFYIGGSTSSNANGIIDNFKLYNNPILPYGSFISSNLIDYTKAHSDITFYWSGFDCTATDVEIGAVQLTKNGDTTQTFEAGEITDNHYYDNVSSSNWSSFPVTSRNIIDERQGYIGVWANVQTILNGSMVFSYYTDIDNEMNVKIIEDTGQYFFRATTKRSGIATYTADINVLLNVNEWHYVELSWDLDGLVTLYVDHMYMDSDLNTNTWVGDIVGLNVGSAWNGATRLDCWLADLTITNNINTPQLPFIPYKGSIHAPLMSKNGTLTQAGTDYQIEWVN